MLFPGLLVLLLGLVLFAVWLLLAVVSFFLFFIPPLQGVFYIALNLLVASLVLMVSGVVIMAAGVSGWWTFGRDHWFARTGEKRAANDRMRISERFGEIVGIVVSLLILLYFYESQVQGTGFFTAAFGPVERFLFYGSWVFGAAVSLVRAVHGRKNAVRPLGMAHSLLFVITAFWLLAVFPFNFAHLGDLLPSEIAFLFSWIPNWLGQLVFLIAGIGGLVNLVYTSVLYSAVRTELHSGRPAQPL